MNRTFLRWMLLVLGMLWLTGFCSSLVHAGPRGCKEEDIPSASKLFWSAGAAPLSFSILDQRTVKPITAANEYLIVLVHGWNPEGAPDPLKRGCEWKDLTNGLVQRLNEVDPEHKWAVVHCNWARDASTGTPNPFDGDANTYFDAPKRAAQNAATLGRDYARALHARCPNLRQIQFVAHSAGSWLARNATEDLLYLNPVAVAELTLLDPFIPGSLLSGTGNGGLTVENMSAIGALPAPDLQHRVWRIENLYVDDIAGGSFRLEFPTYGTNSVFSWPSNIGTNDRLDHTYNGDPYDYHAGPILFYADTIKAEFKAPIVEADLATVTGWRDKGVRRALWANQGFFPQITTSLPADAKVTVPSGQTATMEVRVRSDLESSTRYQWYRIEPRAAGSSSRRKISLPGKTQRVLQITADSTTVGEYVAELHNDLTPESLSFSRIFTVALGTAGTPPPPQISAMSPRSLSADASGGQSVVLSGSGFASGMTLRLEDPNGNTALITPTSIDSASQIASAFNVQGKPGLWKVQAVVGGTTSPVLTFTATSTQPSAAPTALNRIAIEGLPTNLLEGTAANAKVYAFWSDGSKTQVQPSAFASNNSGAIAVSSAGAGYTVTANQVSADTTVVISARYGSGANEKVVELPIIVLNNSSGGGIVTGDIVRNGGMTGDGGPWTTAGDFHINATYSFGGHIGGYAWMATAQGARGNNLTGSMQQQISLPANATSLKLRFSCAVSLDNAAQATGGDYLEVSIRDTNQTNYALLKTVTPLANPEAIDAWREYEIVLTPYQGKVKDLIFGAVTNGSNAATWRIDDVSVEVVSSGPVLMDVAIEGPSVIQETTMTSYKALARFSDNATPEVTGASMTTWSVTENGSISAGQFTAAEVLGERTARISASYTVNGVTKTAYKDVTILNIAPAPVALAIAGPTEIDENSGGQFSAVVQYSNGARDDVTASVNWTVGNDFGSVSPQGFVRSFEVNGDQTLPIEASFAVDGVQVTAQIDVTVKDRKPAPIPTSLAIYGPTAVAEGSLAAYDAEVTYNDGSKSVVPASWLEDSRFSSISSTGTLFTSDVPATQAVQLSASFTANGATVTAVKSIQIQDIRSTIAPPEIIMPAVVEIALGSPVTLVVATSEPATTATVTGLPPGLAFNANQFVISGIPESEGTFEVTISASNDFGTGNGVVLLTVSSDSGPEWIRYQSATVLPFPAEFLTPDGVGGCYLASTSMLAHRTSSGQIDWQKTLPVPIRKISGSSAGIAVAAALSGPVNIDGQQINNGNGGGEAAALLLKFSPQGQLLWSRQAYSFGKPVNPIDCAMNADGSVFLGLMYFKDAVLLGASITLNPVDPSGIQTEEAALVKYRSDGNFEFGHVWGGTGGSRELLTDIQPAFGGAYCFVHLITGGSQVTRKAINYGANASRTLTAGKGLTDMVSDGSTGPAFVFSNSSLGASPRAAGYSDTGVQLCGFYKGATTITRYSSAPTISKSFDSSTAGGLSSFVMRESGNTLSVGTVSGIDSSGYFSTADIKTFSPFADGSALVAGEYALNLSANQTVFLGSSTSPEYSNTHTFIAFFDSIPQIRWALGGGSNAGDRFKGFIQNGPDNWLLLGTYGANAKFGSLPLIAAGGTILLDLQRKTQKVTSETFASWMARGVNASGLAALRANPTFLDADGNGQDDLLDYALGATGLGADERRQPQSTLTSDVNGAHYLSLTFTRSLGRPDAKLALEMSNDLRTWFTGCVYVVGSDATDTPNAVEVNRHTSGQEQTITVRDRTPISQNRARFIRLRATTGTTPIPASTAQ